MTEKRFTAFTDYLGGTQTILDNGERKTLQELLDTMNGLAEENKQLKSDLQKLQDSLWTTEKIRELEKENEQLKQRNDRQYNQLKQLWELIEKEDYNTLRSMLNQRETDEKLLQSEWRTYCD